MNLRSLSLVACAAVSLATSANSQSQIVYAPQDLTGYATQTQLATQSASDIATAGANVPTQASAAGFQTSPQVQALISALVQSFIPGFTPASPGSTATLLTNYPASASNVGKYAVVNDLFGGTNEVLRSGYTAGFGYYWRPQRTDYGTSVTSTGGTLNLTPLQTAPYVYLTGQLASSLTINLSSTNAWPGATFCVSNNATLGVATVNLQGAGLPSTNMIGGASKCAVFDGNAAAWRPF